MNNTRGWNPHISDSNKYNYKVVATDWFGRKHVIHRCNSMHEAERVRDEAKKDGNWNSVHWTSNR